MFGKRRLNEMPPPLTAGEANDAAEIARIWTVNGGLHMSLHKAFEDSAAWGLVLVDVARHVARVYAAEAGLPESETLARIRSMWTAEFERPTDVGSTAVIQ